MVLQGDSLDPFLNLTQDFYRMSEIRNKKITVRYTEKELEEANQKSIGPLAVWLRDLSLSKPNKKKAKPINPELIYHLNKIGVNLNQIAKYCNQQTIFKDGDKVDLLLILASMENELKELRDKYDS